MHIEQIVKEGIVNGTTALSGLVLAKFDSSARAGTVVSVVRELSVPVRFLGVGEALNDLEAFSRERYLDKILAPDP